MLDCVQSLNMLAGRRGLRRGSASGGVLCRAAVLCAAVPRDFGGEDTAATGDEDTAAIGWQSFRDWLCTTRSPTRMFSLLQPATDRSHDECRHRNFLDAVEQ